MKKSGFMAALTLGAMPLLHSTTNAAPQPATPPLAAKAPVWFSIEGEVVKPGKYGLNFDQPTLLDLIVASGGFTRNSARVHVKVRRGARSFNIKIADLLKFQVNFALQDGDVVTVTWPQVFVAGAVKNPDFYPFPENGTLSIAEALMLAGGPLEAQGNDVMRLPAASFGKSQRFLAIPPDEFNQLLQEDDCLFVSNPKVKLSPFTPSAPLFRTKPTPKPDAPPVRAKFYFLGSSTS